MHMIKENIVGKKLIFNKGVHDMALGVTEEQRTVNIIAINISTTDQFELMLKSRKGGIFSILLDEVDGENISMAE